jgi:hypothetical protein
MASAGRSAVGFVVPTWGVLRLRPEDLAAAIGIQALAELLLTAIQVVVAAFVVLPAFHAASTIQDQFVSIAEPKAT